MAPYDDIFHLLTYRGGENRVTSSMLAVFQRLGLDINERILANAIGTVIRWDNTTPGGFRDESGDWEAVGDSISDAMARLVGTTIEIVPTLPRYVAQASHSDVATGIDEPIQ